MGLTSFADLVGCALPLQLAGMGAIGGRVELPVSVSRAGGLGMLGAAGIPPDALEQLLGDMSTVTTGPFGANFLVPLLERDAVVVAAKACSVVEFFYGRPDASLVETVHDAKALAAWQVGSAEEADAAAHAGCDFVIAQGTEAGGHIRGTQPLAEVLADVVAAVRIPVVAAGGIGTASDVLTAIEMGASGARVGTRFLAAAESSAHPAYVDALIRATAADTVVTETFSQDWPNAPHRVLRSAIESAEAEQGEFVATLASSAGEWPVPRYSTMPPTDDAQGNIAAIAMYAGTSVAAVRERRPAAEIVEELCKDL